MTPSVSNEVNPEKAFHTKLTLALNICRKSMQDICGSYLIVMYYISFLYNKKQYKDHSTTTNPDFGLAHASGLRLDSSLYLDI